MAIFVPPIAISCEAFSTIVMSREGALRIAVLMAMFAMMISWMPISSHEGGLDESQERREQLGPDGPTHAGSFDITYLATLPNFVVMAASDEAELVKMINTSTTINDKP